jgi:hypothetical protein
VEWDVSQVAFADGVYNFVLDGTVSNTFSFNALESGENLAQLLLDTAGSDTPLSFSPTEDASVDMNQAGRRIGEQALLQLIRTKDEYQRIYLQFQLSGISSPIEGATLRLYLARAEADASGGIAVYLADSSLAWTDERINLNSAPAMLMDDSPIDSFTLQR